MALSAKNQTSNYVNLYYSIVQRAATHYFKEYYSSGEYESFTFILFYYFDVLTSFTRVSQFSVCMWFSVRGDVLSYFWGGHAILE